jgi:hypothetical protein
MPKLHGVKPHPAFDLSLCPSFRTAVAPAFNQQTKGQGGQPHYPRDYVERLTPITPTIDAPSDVVGYAVTTLVGVWGSMLVALFNPTWLFFDSAFFNLSSFLSFTRETIYLRRVILMAVRVPTSLTVV